MRIHRASTVAFICAALAWSMVSAAPALAVFDAKIYGPTTNVRPGTPLPTGAASAASLAAARNEFESFQLVAEATDGAIGALSVEPGAALARQGGGGTIPIASADPASRMTIYREGFYDVAAEPGLSDIEGALGQWADALIPEVDPIYGENRNAWPRAVPAGGMEIAWIDVHVPPDQPAGTYTGSVLVKNGLNVIDTVAVSLVVRPFTLPSTSSLDNAFYTTYSKPCLAHTGNALCNGDTARSWKLHALYARAALDNRVTIPNPWAIGVDDAPNTEAKKAVFRQYVLPLLDGTGAGEGTRARRLRDARLSVLSQYWQCDETCLASWRDFLVNPRGVAVPPPSDDFRSRFVYYACDEPPNAIGCTWAQAQDRLTKAQAAWPGVARLVTIPPPAAKANGITPDILSPVVNHVDGKDCCGSPFVGSQRQTPDYLDFLDPALDQAGTAANRLWMYTSNMSHGSDPGCPAVPDGGDPDACALYHTNSFQALWRGWPGYVIDQPAAQARAVSWLAFGYDTSGELYWKVSERLETAWTTLWDFGGHGDGTLFYPGTPARIGGAAGTDIPIESIRLKRIRDGREDYEYLRKAVAAGKPAEAMQVFHDVFGQTSAMFSITDAIGDDDFATARAQLASHIATGTCADPDAIMGTPGNDTNLVGTPGDDIIVGLGGEDTIRGLGGNDLLCGGEGFDTLHGGPGNDVLDGQDEANGAEYGPSANPVVVDLGAGVASGDGSDTLIGVNEVYGTPFADDLTGSNTNGSRLEFLAGIGGNDTMDGRGGRDLLRGGDGADTLAGGSGRDELEGGNGADSLVARDGEIDRRVDCGADVDPAAVVDAGDQVAGCEQVDARAVPHSDGSVRGDFNGDGVGDLVVGAPGEDVGAVADAGVVHVLPGTATGVSATGSQLWSQNSAGIADAAEPGDGFGSTLSAGDLNGDGRDDLAIGVPGEDAGTVVDGGAVHVLYGTPAGLAATGSQSWSQNSPSIADATEAGDHLGSVLAIGRLDTDAFADLAVGVPDEGLGAVPGAGLVHVIRGSASGLTATGSQLWTQDTAGIADNIEADDGFGATLAIGDANAAAGQDLAIGAPAEDVGAIVDGGVVHLLFGSATGPSATGSQLWSQNSPSIADAIETGDRFGSVLAIGMLNADAFGDLVVGVPNESVGAIGLAGSVHVIPGSAGGLTATGSQLWTQNSAGVADGAETADGFGASLVIGDLDSTAGQDLAIGAPAEDPGAVVDGGAVHVLYGSAAGVSASGSQYWSQDSSAIADVTEAGDRFGSALATGKLDTDAFADLAIGVPAEGVGAIAGAGAVHVIRGATAGLSATASQLWTQNSAAIADSAEPGDAFGASLGG